jgi:hypothetical protein
MTRVENGWRGTIIEGNCNNDCPHQNQGPDECSTLENAEEVLVLEHPSETTLFVVLYTRRFLELLFLLLASSAM